VYVCLTLISSISHQIDEPDREITGLRLRVTIIFHFNGTWMACKDGLAAYITLMFGSLTHARFIKPITSAPPPELSLFSFEKGFLLSHWGNLIWTVSVWALTSINLLHRTQAAVSNFYPDAYGITLHCLGQLYLRFWLIILNMLKNRPHAQSGL